MTRCLPLLWLVLFAPAVALAQPAPGACCVQSTSKLDSLLNPAVGSDEDFFTSAGGAPNVYFLVDNSGSMTFWPRPLCAGDNGCGCASLDSLGYQPATTYEPELQNLNAGTFHDEWFHNDKVYEVLPNFGDTTPNHSYGQNVRSLPNGTIWAGAGRAGAITAACGGTSNAASCRSCLATKGYYLDRTASRSRMVGNFLNFYSPRYLMLRRTLKQVIREIQPVRMALGTYWPRDGELNETNLSQAPDQLHDFNPPCNLSDPKTHASNFDSNRQSIVNSLDGDIRFWWGTPLARSFWMAGLAFQQRGAAQYDRDFPAWQTEMSISDAIRGDFVERSGPNQRAVCYACTFNAIILLTDGEPMGDTRGPRALRSRQLTWPDCSGAGQCGSTDLDEMAKYLWDNDLRPDQSGKQRVATYTIGFGLDGTGPNSWAIPLLAHTAEVGGGQAFTAYNAVELKRALLDIFAHIDSRATAFSTSNVSAFQASGGNLSALIPRMSPERSKPWSGELWRFDLDNEFVRDLDRNGDGDKDDVFLVDAQNDELEENDEGRFVKKLGGAPAVPHWEARAKLKARSPDSRRIFTVVDSNGDGAFTSTDDPVELTAANAPRLLDYLAIRGAPTCPISLLANEKGSILSALGLDVVTAGTLVAFPPGAAPAQATLDELCARVLIEWVRGRDLGDEDGDGNRAETRDSVLGDIFHSSPLTVGAPVDKFICDLGLAPQCARTLYATDLPVAHTPLETQEGRDCAGNDITEDAYDVYHREQSTRDRLVLVGANDGMLHAFQDGRAVPGPCVGGRRTQGYAAPSGEEVWAFSPPDLLPRLHERLSGHAYYVDADIMVRDVWWDENNDGRKSKDEFRTVAVVPEGRGGTHYFALELRWDAASRTGTTNALPPRFRWLFPQPCSEESAVFGKTFYTLSPKPPPIGPVLLDAESLGATGHRRYGERDSVERWVVALSGGWSPGLERGRGVYLVDAWAGQVNGRRDNLWWKWEFSPTASGPQHDARRGLVNSVAAPVALVDYGEPLSPRIDGFFDTALFGDTGGQLWVLRMFEPGRPSGGLIANWSGGRAFEQDRGARGVANRWPFFFLPTTGIQADNGALRAFIGSGNRYALLHRGPGRCQFDNPQACAKAGCGDVEVDSRVSKLEVDLQEVGTEWLVGMAPQGTLARATASQTACGVVGTPAVTATLTEELLACPSVADTTARSLSVECKQRTAGDFRCEKADTSTWTLEPLEVTVPPRQLDALGKARFYGVWAFGGRADRTFDEASASPGAQSASEFDARRLTDRGGGGSGDLVDVTRAGCAADGSCTGATATSEGFGWVLEYDHLDRKTATGATLVNGCVLWSSLTPADGGTGLPCELDAVAKTSFLQSNYVTGRPDCAQSFVSGGVFRRGIEFSARAPPPEPALVVQVNPDGILRMGTVALPTGGAPQSFTIGETQDPLQMVYELPVPRALHNCRHTDAGCTGEVY